LSVRDDELETRARAVILGCAGPALGADEAAFFAAARPFGFILFARNCESPDQVRALVGDLRSSVDRADAPVLIDQEGGRVTRLGAPHWRRPPPAARFADLAQQDLATAIEATRLNARLIAADLAALGIDVDCAPVLDLPRPDTHAVIGDRILGHDPETAATLGRAFCDGLLAGGVLPVIKHIPGHGRATVDSHDRLPVVDAPRPELEEQDFAPFRALADMPWAMTAHVVYSAIDAKAPATTSPQVIADVIRQAIGFGGLLLSDDLSMQALAGDLGERTRAALAAGCDIALHCNGDPDEMERVVAAAPVLSAAAIDRIAAGRDLVSRYEASGFDGGAAADRLDELLGSAAT
jgi:beta-N-acetylhexosaminidase